MVSGRVSGMSIKGFDERLARERRARLQAERLLAQRSEELYSANKKLAEHAHALSHTVIAQREENAALIGRSTRTQAALEVATEKAVIAERRLPLRCPPLDAVVHRHTHRYFPLYSMSRFSLGHYMREMNLTEDQRLYAETIQNSGEALLAIINDILDYSKIDAGKMILHEESFDLRHLIDEIFRLMRPGLEGKDLRLILDYDMFLPARLIGDPGRVRQILTNLIGNAVKFTESGHVTVRAVGVPDPKQPALLPVRIVVEDTGIGIAPEMQSHIFGEFNQVEAQATRRFDGTGLGLAITRQLVALMRGKIWLESRLGVGSSFGLSLVFGCDPAGLVETAPAIALAAPPKRRLHVLAAEDNKTNQLVFRAMLKSIDLHLELVENGALCLESYHRARPDLILTDISMPEMDGLALARAVRAHEGEFDLPRLPIIAMTAHAMESDRTRILAAGIDECLTKPLDKTQLLAAIGRYAPPEGAMVAGLRVASG